MDLSQSYKQRPNIDDHYDVICIGSGLSCLTVANILSRYDQKVLVLEKHYTPGGFTHVFTRPEYEWDVGVHYVGDVHRKGTIMSVLFNYITDGKMEWEDMGEVYDRIVFGDKIYDFVKGSTNFKKKMYEYFPEEKKAIDQYVNLVHKTTQSSRFFFLEKILPEPVRYLASNLLRRKFLSYADQTTEEVMNSLSDNQELIAVLTGQFGDYGLTPDKSSFAMHAILVRHYLQNGGSYPVGGSESFVKYIAPKIYERGGAVITNADVCEILIKDNKAYGVKMKDGREILATHIVSGAGIDNTLNKLIPPDYLDQFPTEEYKSTPASVGHFSLYVGFKESAKDLQMPKANYWIFPDNYNHVENEQNYMKDPDHNAFPVVYISFPAAKDPDYENRYPNKSTLEIISLAPYEWFTKWEGTKWKKRGADYDALKEKVSKRLLEKLYEREPQLKGKVDYYELSTPLTTKHFANYQHGEIYGIEHTPDRFRKKSLRPKTAIKNFYLTGQDVMTAGIGSVAMGGLLTSSAILKKNLMAKLMRMRND